MTRESGLLLVALAVLVLLGALFLVKKGYLFGPQPDRRISVATPDGKAVELQAWFADTQGQPAPALLLFHGGTWQYGNPDQFRPQCEWFAARGFHGFSASYRLGTPGAPEVRGASGDAQAALAYLQDNAAALCIDAARIAVGGGSAGGHLAASLGTAIPVLPADRVRPAAMILFNPMLNLSPGRPDHHLVEDSWLEVSPHQAIDARTPSGLVLVGDRDGEVPVPTVELFCEAMAAAGATCEAAVYPGVGHGFFNYSPQGNPYFEQCNERVLAFLATTWQ